MSNFRARIERLEHERGERGEFLIVEIVGGFAHVPSPEQKLAMIAAARANGERFVCIGGVGLR